MSQRFSCSHSFLENAVLGQVWQVAGLYWVWLKEMNEEGFKIFRANMFSFPILKQTWDHGDRCFISLRKEKCQKFNKSLLLGRESAV